jgi:hypothetical protein
MKKIIQVLMWAAVSIFFCACPNPVPVVSSISPDTKLAHLPTFVLTVYGSDFASGSEIVFNGIGKTTTRVSSTELTCEVDPNDIATGPMNIPVLVRSPNGDDSNSVNLAVVPNPNFTLATNLSNNPETSLQPDIAVSPNGQITSVWKDAFVPGGPATEIVLRRSTDGGATWDAKVNVSNNATISFEPSIGVSPDNGICVVWPDEAPVNEEIYFSRSTDNGATWPMAQNISNNTGDSNHPRIIIDGSGTIFVVWHDETPGQQDIYFSASADAGLNWTTAVNVSNSGNVSRYPDLAVGMSGGVFIVWEEQLPGAWPEVYFSRSNSGGASWSTPVSLTPGIMSGAVKIAADDFGNLHVVYSGYLNYEVCYLRSPSQGNNWTPPINLSTPFVSEYSPCIATDSAGNINVVWAHFKTEGRGSDMVYRRSINNGLGWGPRIHVEANNGITWYTGIEVDALGYAHIVWDDGTPGSLYGEVFYSRSIE